MPTSSFAPELFEIFRKASQEKFEIKLENKQAAFALRYRLNKLRAEMRKELHYMTDVANSVSFIIVKPHENVLVCAPADKSYLNSIRQAIGEPSKEALAAQAAMKDEVEAKKITGEQALDEFFKSTGG